MNHRKLQVKRFLSSVVSLEVQSEHQDIQALGILLHSDLRLYINASIYIQDLFLIHMIHCMFFKIIVAVLNTLADHAC